MMPGRANMTAPNTSGAATPMLLNKASRTFPTCNSQPVPSYGAADNKGHPVFPSPGAWGGSIVCGPSIACGAAVFRKGASPPWACSAAWGTSGARGRGWLGEAVPVGAALRTIGNNKVVGPLTPYLN
jgi:hypothetical protein